MHAEWRVDFGYQLINVSKTEENQGQTLIELSGRRTFQMRNDF